ncbi:unnamed protein product [Fusarium graminearum]|uniref:Chromosome 1, complete genome n=1 Tax=Gibberella zeae (strain ATCC MYA-4620 / CBS 123657 / FGSC 9075 / NRRL 31084 / PH-1) TaxID=229533 RepID=A0A098D601_GIBZE|nr:unnamed protein product [Fusarium graminearum]CZS77141.1 unnamed protein product [Fusarium graminearum]
METNRYMATLEKERKHGHESEGQSIRSLAASGLKRDELSTFHDQSGLIIDQPSVQQSN